MIQQCTGSVPLKLRVEEPLQNENLTHPPSFLATNPDHATQSVALQSEQELAARPLQHVPKLVHMSGTMEKATLGNTLSICSSPIPIHMEYNGAARLVCFNSFCKADS